jgi:TIR domain
MRGPMLNVFISYAREDHEVVDRLHDDLTRPGLASWLDRERLDPGKDWNREIDERIRDCSHFIAVVSPHSLRDDRFVRREWDQALG